MPGDGNAAPVRLPIASGGLRKIDPDGGPKDLKPGAILEWRGPFECSYVVVGAAEPTECSHRAYRAIALDEGMRARTIPATDIKEPQQYAAKPGKPADADEWWKPEDEHREKYAGGRGFYLGPRRGSGWQLRKVCFYGGGPGRDNYITLAGRHSHLRPDER